MKRFNLSGVCVKEKHYMVNIDKKLQQIIEIIEYGDYFVINRPRQFGKTTTLSLLEENLREKYIVISISFEGIGDDIFSSERNFSEKIFEIFSKSLRFLDLENSKKLKDYSRNLRNLSDVSNAITDFLEDSQKEVILLIDEIDKSSNNQLFLSFLGLLRSKYLDSQIKKDLTFKSVVLCGVHDVKNLKLKLRDEEEKKQNSPWNIAVKFDIDMTFDILEIKSMLDEYKTLNDIDFDSYSISEKIYFYSSGYPYLVSSICYTIDKYFKDSWNLDSIDKSVKIILNENNTLFESLIKNLENNVKFKDFIEKIILNGEIIPYTPSDNLILKGIMYGFLKEENGMCKVQNRIFEQYIYNHLSSSKYLKSNNMTYYNFKDKFINDKNGLNIDKVLLKFQEFMKKEYSTLDKRFIEREGRLLFLAFIKPIINGVGFDFKEVVISEEKRLDIVITYNEFKYLIELKIWYGEKYHQKGVSQLVNYLDKLNLNKGYLLIFNFNMDKKYKSETIFVDEKEIFIVYV